MAFLDEVLTPKVSGETPVKSGGGFLDSIKTPDNQPIPQISQDFSVGKTQTSTPALSTSKHVSITKELVDAYNSIKGAVGGFLDSIQPAQQKPQTIQKTELTGQEAMNQIKLLPQSEISTRKAGTTTTKNPEEGYFFPTIFKPASETNQDNINVRVPFTQKFVEIPSPFTDRIVFGGQSDNLFNKGAGIVANLPTDILQAVPKAIVTGIKEYQTMGQTKTEKLSPFLSALYGSPEYTNINQDIQNKIQNGDGVVASYIGGISGKVLDVAFGASIVASAFTKLADILASRSSFKAIEAWKTLGSPKTDAELVKNYKQLALQLHPDKVGGSTQAFQTITKAKDIIEKEGIPSVMNLAEQNSAKYLEWIGRETKLGAGENFLKPNLTMKEGINPQPLGLKALPGTAPVGGKLQPKLGLSIQPVERVGGAEVNKPKDLVEEANKSNSLDEFLNKQGSPLYHRTNTNFTEFSNDKKSALADGIHLFANKEVSDTPAMVNRFGKNQIEAYVSGKIATITSKDMVGLSPKERATELKKQGYAGYKMGDEVVVFDANNIKTKSQLTDIWNKASENKETVGVYYRGSSNTEKEISINTDKNASYGNGVYLTDNPKIAKEYGKNISEIIPTKNLNLRQISDIERNEIVSLFGKEQKDYINSLLQDGKYDGLKIPERNGDGNEIVVYDKNILKIKSSLSEADRLIAEGKIRVKSVNGKDTYQIKKGGEWTNVRDEDSAVKQLTKAGFPKVKKEIVLPQNLEEKKLALEFKRESLDNNPAKKLEKYEAKSGAFKGELPESLGATKEELATNKFYKTYKSANVLEFIKRGDDIASEAGFDNAEQARTAYEKYKQDKEEFKKAEVELRKEINDYKNKPIEKVVKPSEIPKAQPITGKEQGEVKSIELQARQAISMINGEDIEGSVSLPKIISNTVTPVQNKVHIIDTYLRTPNRVMSKIGFGNEAIELRHAMDGYWKELPKNIEKIDNWRTSVPKESNERIFKFLDGQAITLNKEENKVAEEIKNWLKEWANRLKLPEDKRITDYITHIFTKESMQEFDEELAKMISDKIPGEVYNPFLLERLGAKGYLQDTWKALDAYVKRGTRKVYVDPVLEKIRSKAGSTLEFANVEKSQFKYIQRYIDNVNMRPSEFDESVDNFIKAIIGYKLGQRPATTILRFFRQLTFRGMIGLNVGSAMRNLSQGANTFAILGSKYTAVGYSSLFKSGAVKELENEGVFNAGFVQDKVLSATGRAIEKIDKGLFALFDTAEKINRGSAYFGAKAKFYEEHTKIVDGKAVMAKDMEENAVKYAKNIVRKTQFQFDTVDTPVGLQSDVLKTVFQLQTYTIKQIEFLTEMARDKNFAGLIRYAVAGLLFVYTIGQAFGMNPKELIPMFRFDTPPSLKVFASIISAVFNSPDNYGKPRGIGKKISDIGSSAIGLIPAGTQIKKTYQGADAITQGMSTDKSGKKQFSVGGDFWKDTQAILFGKYASQEAKDYFSGEKTALNQAIADIKAQNQEYVNKNVLPIYEKAKKLDLQGKTDEADALFNSLSTNDKKLYNKLATVDKRRTTLALEEKVFPTVQKAKELDKQGRSDEADSLFNSLSDEEKKAFNLVSKKLNATNTSQ